MFDFDAMLAQANGEPDHITIKLLHGLSTIIDREDWVRVKKYNWVAVESKPGRVVVSNSEVGYLHRFIMKAAPGIEIDHRNRDTLDNRKQNLRPVSSQENNRNRRGWKNAKSKFKGVFWRGNKKNKWRAMIGIDKKVKCLGDYPNQLQAALAYDDAAHILFGEHAALNFPERYPPSL